MEKNIEHRKKFFVSIFFYLCLKQTSAVDLNCTQYIHRRGPKSIADLLNKKFKTYPADCREI